MKKFLIPLFSLLVCTSISQAESTDFDPYSVVEHIKYDNGLQVFLAPSQQATNTAIRLEVRVGWEAEKENERGLSHLLEHVLFRDKQLKDEMTYLQLIREAGGVANGSTGGRVTSYFGTIPYKKGSWMFENFTKMILEPTIASEYVEKEKGTVELEIGTPNPISVMLGFNPMDYLYPSYLRVREFWETEFGFVKPQRVTSTEEQLSNRRLTTDQVQKHYDDYYHPGNMLLFVAGKYDRDEIMKLVESKWSVLPKRDGKVMGPVEKVNPKLAAYKHITFTNENPYIYLGTKFWDFSVREYEVLSSYTDYLAHRLMKEIRNLKGQTYTAFGEAHSFQRAGYTYVGFQTQKSNMHVNTDLAKKYLHDASQGNLSEDQVKEAISLYMGGYDRSGKEAQDMMDLAQTYEQIVNDYGKFESPYSELKNVKVDEYNAILKKYFKPEQSYQYIYEPYFFFHFDIYLLCAVTAIGTFFILRRLWTKKFEHDQIRWIRKLNSPPLRSLEAFALLGGWFIFVHFNYFLELLFSQSFMQSHILVAEYLNAIVWVACLLVVMQGVISLLPQKLMIVRDTLIVKSASYFSKHFPMKEVESFEKVSLFSARFWGTALKANWKFRFYYFNLLFWKPGVMLRMKGGQCLFFSVNDVQAVTNEFEKFWKDHQVSERKAA